MDHEQTYQEWLCGKQNMQDVSLASLAPIIERVCGGAAGIDKAHRIVEGHSSVVFEVPTPQQQVIVRAKVAPEPSYATEVWAIEQCRRVGVPAPEVLGVHRQMREDGHWLSVCIEAKCPGQPLLEVFTSSGPDSPRSLDLARQVGAILASMHSIRPDGFGPLDDCGQGTYGSYAEHVREVTHAVINRLQENSAIDIPLVMRAGAWLLDHADELQPSQPSLLHGDPGPDHWFVDGDRICGLIDLEAVQGGDPALDLAWWDYWRDWRLPYAPTSAILQGYSDDALLQPSTLPGRLALARLFTSLTSLDYWVCNGRQQQTQQSLDLLRLSVRKTGLADV